MYIQANEAFLDSLSILSITVHFFAGYNPETMKPIKSLEYSGDLTDLGMHVWTDLRRFNQQMFTFDKDLITGLSILIKGLKNTDPRVSLIREKLHEYILLLGRKNNASAC